MTRDEEVLDQLKDQLESFEWFCAVADPGNGMDDATADAMKRDLGSACVTALPALIAEDKRLRERIERQAEVINRDFPLMGAIQSENQDLRRELAEAIKGCEIAAEALVDFVGLAKAVRAAQPFLQRHHASQIAPHEWFSSEVAAVFDALKATE